jgi:hypothetical protein
MSIDQRIINVKQSLESWFIEAKNKFPKKPVQTDVLISLVDIHCRCNLRDLLDQLDPVLARLKKENQIRLYEKLKNQIEYQGVFELLVDSNNIKDFIELSTGRHTGLITILEQCYNYFAPIGKGRNTSATQTKEPQGLITLKTEQIEMLNWYYEEYPQICYVAAYSKFTDKTKRGYATTLRESGFIERPEGKKKGDVITVKGRNYIEEHFS